MELMEELRAVVAAHGEGAAVRLVEQRAGAGDAGALTMLGHWRLFGTYVPRDLAAGRRLIAEAARQGDRDAALVEVALVANGVGAAPDPARAAELLAAIDHPEAAAQRRLLADADRAIPKSTVLREKPYVARLDGLWSAGECDHVIAKATPRMQPSWVVDPASGRRVRNPVRTSDGTNFGPLDEDIVLHLLNERLARATGTVWAQGEPLHVLRYEPGQEYRWHVDALPGVANQRTTTVLVYLSDGFDGGETAFEGGLTVRGRPGDAIVFSNVTADGRVDAETRHAGRPVTAGTKWLATRWIRARPIDPWRPETLR
jgi:prolyl 4-hydroxylase